MTTSISKLPGLNDLKPTPAENIQEFAEKGHTLVKNILSADEIAAYEPVIVGAAERYNTERRKMEDRDTYGKAFLQIFNLWRQNDVLKKFVLAKRFAHVAAKLMGVDRVRLYHDQALFKEPGGGPTPWHQDQYYWPLDTNNTITMWMPLVNLTEEMGIMHFASQTHQLGYVTAEAISDTSEQFFSNFVKQNNYKVDGARQANAGDASFHSG